MVEFVLCVRANVFAFMHSLLLGQGNSGGKCCTGGLFLNAFSV